MLSDREPRALFCALAAAAANGLPCAQPPPGTLPPDVAHADFPALSAAAAGGPHSALFGGQLPVAARVVDWHSPPAAASLGGAFDVVLACDVLYEEVRARARGRENADAACPHSLPRLLSQKGP